MTSQDSPIVETMKRAVTSFGEKAVVSAMPCSSDTWVYSNQLGIPAILFGAGRLSDAHSDHEMISIDDLEKASDILHAFIIEWCGIRA